ncbi:hypothetical protein LTR17_003998 [Elasticomyces elasticus]|nr:hypothetical protein LTR17_003998 [Elasticomyces elasticus]
MFRFTAAALVAVLYAPDVLGTQLFVSHYTGKIYTLNYEASSSGNGTLSIESSASECGKMPAWLALDPKTSTTLYCFDESYGSGVAKTAGGDVHGWLYGGSDGQSFVSTAEYGGSSISTYKLALTSSSKALQKLAFTMTGSGTDPSRQDAPHPHSTVTDPTGQYIIVPDLGADLIRIFSIDASSGELTACKSAKADAGDGPRHGSWRSPDDASVGGLMLYTVNELGNSVTGWKAAEVHVRGNFLYAANRNDQLFGSEQDSIATYNISSTGEVEFVEATNSHSWYPRTFLINREGDLVAVGGQTSSNVAIIARDTETGRLGGLLANVQVATPGNDGQEDGLSAVYHKFANTYSGDDSLEGDNHQRVFDERFCPNRQEGFRQLGRRRRTVQPQIAVHTPAAVAVPTIIDHIQAAMSCALKFDMKATAKSGGHSYASLGLGGEDGHLISELDRMYNVTLDTDSNVATVQPGARLGHVANELWDQGKRAISAGTCPGVGVSGHSLHGGYGMSSHKYGLAVDWIAGMTVVLANASIVHTSATEHPDLFWALKGAGSSPGIVAEYEFNTFPAPEEVTYFSMPFKWNASSAPAKLEALEAYTRETMPAELTILD